MSWTVEGTERPVGPGCPEHCGHPHGRKLEERQGPWNLAQLLGHGRGQETSSKKE